MTPATTSRPSRSRPSRSRAAALLLAAAAALASLLIAAPPAAAHATLTDSSPADGEVVATAPERVTLTFSEQVALADDAIRVLDPEGRPVTTGEPTDMSSGDTIRHAIALRDGLDDGTYTVAWHVVSADSHPISGAFTFSVGAPSATSAEVPDVSGDDGLVGLLYDVARYAAYVGFLVLAGGGAFVLRCWPRAAGLRPAQRVLLTGWTTLTVATLCQLLLRTPYTGSGRLADAFDPTGLRDVVETTAGTALLTRLLLLAAAGAFIAVLTGPYARLRAAAATAGDTGEDTAGETGEDAAGETAGDTGEDTAGETAGNGEQARVRDLGFGLGTGGAIVAAGIAATWAMSEHASTGPQTGLAVPVDALHLVAAAAWIGGLAMLLMLLRHAPLDLPRTAVRRFSGLAMASVVTLAATGVYQSWRQVRTVSGLTDTDFGRLLLLKVALVAALLGLASFSRRYTARLAEPRTAVPAQDTAVGDAAQAAGETAGPADEAAEVSPERAAQLARQRDAVRRARQRRERDADPTRRALRRSVLAEAAVAAVVLGVTTVLTTTTPARTEAVARQDSDVEQPGPSDGDDAAHPSGPFTAEVPYDTGGDSGQGVAEIQVSPASTGANTLHVTLLDPEGQPAAAVEINVALTLDDEGIGPLRHTAEPLSDNHWAVADLQLPRPGDWELALTIRTSDIDQVTETTTVPIG